jgi:hypothetical protein
MTEIRDILGVAEHLSRELGPRGAATVADRAEAHRQAGEHESALFWRRVARAMAAGSRPSAGA